MSTNTTSRAFLALVAVLLAITLLAAGAAAWLHWGAATPGPATEPKSRKKKQENKEKRQKEKQNTEI